MTHTPLVFFAFANNNDRHLALLKDESRAVFESLQTLEQSSSLSIHREESTQFDELYKDLLAYDGRIVIFHYAGHADGTLLELEGGHGSAGGIAKLLGQQKSLKLVFLNGCATKNHVRLLHEAGVPAVIATSVKVADTRAKDLSLAFYAALAKGHSIFAAFELAKAYLEGISSHDNGLKFSVESVNTRSFHFDFAGHEREQNQSIEFEWALYVKQECEHDLKQWQLNKAKEAWEISLSDSNGPILDSHDKPLRHIYQSRVRKVLAVKCDVCENTVALNSESASVTVPEQTNRQETFGNVCHLCRSNRLKEVHVHTSIPDKYLPFEISEQQVREIALSTLDLTDDHSQASIRMHKMYMPYWVYCVETNTACSVQLGTIKDVHADALSLNWEKVNKNIDFNLEQLLVPGFDAKNVNSRSPANWTWSDTNAQTLDMLELGTSFLPLDKSPQDAFSQVLVELQDALENEAQYIIGGAQYKQLSFNTRYKHVSFHSIFLPHWSVISECGALLINGVNGSVRQSPQQTHIAPIHQRLGTMNHKDTPSQAQNDKTSYWISIFSGAGIGIMVGLLMGLAAPQGEDAKSVVAIFIGAVGVGLAALLGLNDKHFSTAKGLRIGSFGIAVSLAALSGIYVRDNHLLSPSLAERASELEEVFKNITTDQKLALLTDSVTTTKADGTVMVASQSIRPVSALFSSSGVNRSLCDELTEPAFQQYSAKELNDAFRELDPESKLGWTNLVNGAEQELSGAYEAQKATVLLAVDAACGYISQVAELRPDSDICQTVMNTNNSDELRATFETSDRLKAVLEELVTKVPEPQLQLKALELIKPVLCSASTTVKV